MFTWLKFLRPGAFLLLKISWWEHSWLMLKAFLLFSSIAVTTVYVIPSSIIDSTSLAHASYVYGTLNSSIVGSFSFAWTSSFSTCFLLLILRINKFSKLAFPVGIIRNSIFSLSKNPACYFFKINHILCFSLF